MTPEQRLEALTKFVDASPRDPEPRYHLAMAYRTAGRLDEAARAFAELESGHPDYVPAYLMRGQLLEQMGRPKEAAEVYRRGLEVTARARSIHARSELASALEALEGSA